MFQELAAPFVWISGTAPTGRAQHPVTMVTFEDAGCTARGSNPALANRSACQQRQNGRRPRVVGSSGSAFPGGTRSTPSRANYLPDPDLKLRRGTTEVTAHAPNGYKVYGMAGNVWQWVSDWYAADYYARGQYLNPPGPASGELRVVRGGSWVNNDTNFLRCACRHPVPIDSYSYSIGFRVAY